MLQYYCDLALQVPQVKKINEPARFLTVLTQGSGVMHLSPDKSKEKITIA